MAKFKILPNIDVSTYMSAKFSGALTDNDVGKPVKLAVGTTDTYTLCADGDIIDAFIVGLEPATADGLKFGTIHRGPLVRCEASGSMTIGDLVEAGAVAAAGTAETNGLPLVSTRAAVSANITNTATGTEIATAVNALLAAFTKPAAGWRVVSGNTSNGSITTGDTTVVIMRL